MPAPGNLTTRQKQILAVVQEVGFTTIETLAARFDVSAQTVRREIIRLQEQNYLQRFHGGAGLASGGIRSAYAQKLTVSPQGKQRIGEALAGIIPAGASVFLDVGTTVEAAARALLGKPGLRVVTASVSVAQIFCQGGVFDVVVTGGVTRGANGSLVGQQAIATIAGFRFDYTILGIGGFDDDGAPMDFDLEKIAVRQAAMARSRQTVVLADHSKFNQVGTARITDPGKVALVVVDAEPTERLRKAWLDCGCRWRVA
ncbi:MULTISPECIES: DeoR/GlpR family DNA-binding transcription regulator [Bosea]|uniref:DeoR/GlpR family DNA-binding transcription regulator n=1 Tax=Bosea TaxID=85413 RepID=UPI002150145C|nr:MULTISPECIES: DeoR/GlpR family DNA-binding transcription regulator [Bosea]MCR4521671.1 DeoR/GlpR family DNA-binding transcription regulator [Bosea sp. 47.2.35]MDR6828230.1 DeoR family glycerol-3-phosphate regulon repressor [Bosea robiniae]MDR6897798.1 DeoR family glycerol-3-phosphate regulon repressor [Bosea sp. BE109]MDR7141229.1 DeoR family glycerol-3-phosphate regulon repressor [Bosea sp. BE168]MDR7177891.1 DeoR family glycerol-3-phosphate regulon repressor [Bosea sp. BE271]